MPNPISQKKLIYIVNTLEQNTAQHYAHIPRLLLELRRSHHWEIVVFQEKGSVPSSDLAEVLPIILLSTRNRLVRVANLVGNLIKYRLKDYRLVFVRISIPAALIASLVGRVFGMRIIFWQSGMAEIAKPIGLYLKRNKPSLAFWACKQLIHGFATGPETMVRYYRESRGVPSEKLLLLYNDVDPSWVASDGCQVPLVDSTVRLLIFNRLSPVRRLRFYLPDILETLESVIEETGLEIKLDILGGGPEAPAIADIVSERSASAQVTLHGAVPNSEIPSYLKIADVVLIPSYQEGMPRVLLEAMAAAKAVVSTDTGGIRDLVGPLQSEFISSRLDPADFAKKMRFVLKEQKLRQMLSEENAKTVTRFSTKVVAEMYDKALLGVLTG